jgi:hypothetical protein
MTREQLLHIQASSRVLQARYDSALESWGVRAPQMTLGQDIGDYHRSLAVLAKKQLPDGHKFRKVQYRSLQDDAFSAIEPDLLRAVSETGKRNDSVPVGQMREITETGRNGEKVTKFIGQQSFIVGMKPPVRYVTSFTTDHGRFRSGRGWF